MRQSNFILLFIALSGCTHMNIYQGDDAAIIPVVCSKEVRNDSTGKSYQSYVTIFQIDGNFTGSGHGCSHIYEYKIKPGIKSIKLAINLDNSSDSFITYGIVEAHAELTPQGNYRLVPYYKDNAIGVKVVNAGSNEIVGEGETRKIGRSTKANAAVMALPFILK